MIKSINLEEALNYRNNCPFCQAPLILSSDLLNFNLPVVSKEQELSKIELSSIRKRKTPKIVIKSNGKIWQKNCNFDTLYFNKNCSECFTKNYKHEAIYSNLRNIKEIKYSFVFGLLISNDKFICHPVSEIIRYFDKKSFYHLSSSFNKNITYLTTGAMNNKLSEVLSISVPAQMININSTEHFIKKIQTYALLS